MTQHVGNEDILRKIQRKISHIHITETAEVSSKHNEEREFRELKLTLHTEGKCLRGKQQVTYLTYLC